MPDSTSLPLYLRTAEALIRDIAAGRLEDGARLPPEREMADSLGLSVGTLRKALANLESKGLLERRHVNVRAAARAALVLDGHETDDLIRAPVLTVPQIHQPVRLDVHGRLRLISVVEQLNLRC